MDGNKLSTIEMVAFEPLFKLFRGGPSRSSWPSACVFMFFFLEQVHSGRCFRVVACLCTNYVAQSGLKPEMLGLIACILTSGRRSTFHETIKGTRVQQAQDSCGHIRSALCNSLFSSFAIDLLKLSNLQSMGLHIWRALTPSIAECH